MSLVHLFVLGGAVVAFGAASVLDLLRRRIPNILVLTVGALALLRVASDGGAHSVVDAIDAAIVLLVCLALWLRGWFGAGDGKLMAAASLLVGAPALPGFLVVTAFIGGALGAAAMADQWCEKYFGLSTGFAFPLAATSRATAGALATKASVPYGVAVSLAGLATLFATTFAAG